MRIKLLVLALLSVIYCKGQGVIFENSSLAVVKEKAKASGKMIFIDCYTDWCGPCKRMDLEVFNQKQAGDYLNAQFIAMKSDMEKGEGVNLAMRYGITAYPTYLILNAEGKLIYAIAGFMPTEELLAKLKDVTENRVQKYEGYSAAMLEFPEFYKQAFKNKKSTASDSVINAFFSQDIDIMEEKNWIVTRHFISHAPKKTIEWILDNYAKIGAKYGASEFQEIISDNLSIRYHSAIGNNDSLDFSRTLVRMDSLEAIIRPGSPVKTSDHLLDWTTFFERNNRWDEYIVKAKEYRIKYGNGYDIDFCKEIASSDNLKALLVANAWNDEILKKDSSFFPVFCKFRILYKQNHEKEAMSYLYKAIDLVAAETPASREKFGVYLVNNTYSELIKSPLDEPKFEFFKKAIFNKIDKENIHNLHVLFRRHFYVRFKLYNKLYALFLQHWPIINNKYISRPILRNELADLHKQFEADKNKLKQITQWEQDINSSN